MTTIQIIGITVAVLAGLLFVVALIVTGKSAEPQETDTSSTESFLGEAPQDTFSALGKTEARSEDVTQDPVLHRATEAQPDETPRPADAEDAPQPGGAGLDWDPDLSVRTTGHDAALSGASGAAVRRSRADARLVPLSEIIVTTSTKLVDLEDSDVRRMLTELVTYEIDQAAEFRRRGQTVDAMLQLAEAEKVSRALSMTESAERIRAMMDEIQASPGLAGPSDL